MMHLSDEILNAYIDNELDYNKINEINDHIKICSECLNRLKAQKGIEYQLKNLATYNVSDNFTSAVMKKINNSVAHFQPKKSYFFRVIFGFFIVVALAICVTAFAAIAPTASGYDIEIIIKNVSENASGIFSSYKLLFSRQIISIIRSVLLITILASLYFFYETHKNMKDHLNKFR
jgi:hypothetical protein